jgi:protein phosphatase
MNVRVGAATDIGLVREGNEDAYLLDDPLFAVADGMGGHRGGEVASRLALETLERLFGDDGALTEHVQEANRAVFERSSLDRTVAGMGTTLTAAVVEGNRARLAHVGDSRAYLLRAGELRMLTEDHTLVHRMVKQGEITEAEAERHPQRSVVTRALGVEHSVPVDEVIIDLEPGDRLLICSDGLTSMVEDGSIADILERDPDPQRAADALVRAANDAGGVDNTTVVVVAVDEEASSSEPASASEPRRTQTLVAPGRSRTAPEAGPRRARDGARPPWSRIALVAGVAVALVVVAIVGLRVYLDSQWYVGVSNGRVAIFRGIPTEVAGFELHHVVIETTVDAAGAEAAAQPWEQLPDGITADGLSDADQIVAQIRRDVAAAKTAEQPTKKDQT